MIHSLVYRLGYCETISLISVGYYKVIILLLQMLLLMHKLLLIVVQLLSHVQLFATPWTVAHQASPSMGFSRQEYWSGLPFPSQKKKKSKTTAKKKKAKLILLREKLFRKTLIQYLSQLVIFQRDHFSISKRL